MRYLHALTLGVSLLVLTHDAYAQCPEAKAPASCQSFATYLSSHNMTPVGATQELVLDQCVTVPPRDYTFKYVNVVDGGVLFFEDPATAQTTTFKASAILVEQGGKVQAGAWCQPFGQHGGKLEFQLWGDDPTNQGKNADPQDKGIGCKGGKGDADPDTGCYPKDRKLIKACTDPSNLSDPCNAVPADDHSDDNAIFEGYKPLMLEKNLFGYKVFAVSYGGSLQLFGKKGVRPADFSDKAQESCLVPPENDQHKIQPWADLSGNSWALLNANAADKKKDLTLDRSVDWAKGDKIVVATTDWSAGHSEIATVDRNQGGGKLSLAGDLGFPHHGQPFSVTPGDSGNPNTEVDMRGAVGLLTRSITIRSLGKTATDPFPAARDCGTDKPDCYFGGHVVVRQGFAKFQLQGVELYQLGQGGRMGHYPIHFHTAKVTNYRKLLQVPKTFLGNAFVKDSSIWESNTRFVTLHATHDVVLARNVGFLSMGHAFYLEDGTEIDNLLCQNLGVSARASYQEYFKAQDPDSPTHRFIPPILNEVQGGGVPKRGSDALFPTMFWIMNAYNEFVGNKAVGVYGLGPCYWLFDAQVSGPSKDMQWSRKLVGGVLHQTHSPLDYANLQALRDYQPPLKRFRGNSCSTAAYGLTTQVNLPGTPGVFKFATAVPNPYIVHQDMLPVAADNFMPKNFVKPGNPDYPVCLPSEFEVQNSDGCSTTIIDRFTTSFNWSEATSGSVWLRPGNFLFLNSAITDQLYGGLAFVTGGSPEQALPRNLMLTRNSVFVGSTRPDDRFAGRTGPDTSAAGVSCNTDFCAGPKSGFLIYAGGHQPKRLLTIYDGPFFSEGSVFQNTAPFTCDPWKIGSTGCGIYSTTYQPLCGSATNKNRADASCVVSSKNNPSACGAAGDPKMLVIDAGVGWKQPNGFYYPPAFAFRKTNFAGSTERHNVFDQNRTYVQGAPPGTTIICQPLPKFGGLTPIDFTTILNDLDGTLNGMIPDPAKTESRITNGLSRNSFYNAPHQVPECSSFGTDTSPFGYVSSVLAKLVDVPAPGYKAVDPEWTWIDKDHKPAPMIPIYRQLKVDEGEACKDVPAICSGSKPGCQRGSFMMGANNGQAPALTVNHGIYYIDTAQDQTTGCVSTNELFRLPKFEQRTTYMLYQLYATKTTQVTYQVYVGEDFAPDRDGQWVRVHAHKGNRAMEVTASAPLGKPRFGKADGLPPGMLEVTLDNSQPGIAKDFDFGTVDPEVQCQPRDICSPDPGSTQCTLAGNLTEQGPLKGLLNDLKQVCEFWATRSTGQTKDGVFLSDCPANGCIGFAFTLPQGFAPKSYTDSGAAGLVKTYPTNESPWNVPLKAVDARCATSEVPLIKWP
jgi:hypothetical protein